MRFRGSSPGAPTSREVITGDGNPIVTKARERSNASNAKCRNVGSSICTPRHFRTGSTLSLTVFCTQRHTTHVTQYHAERRDPTPRDVIRRDPTECHAARHRRLPSRVHAYLATDLVYRILNNGINEDSNCELSYCQQ